MSRKPVPETFVTKITRNDRFAQMSKQEEIIEQKKREIQARLELKKTESTVTSTNDQKKNPSTPAPVISKPKITPKKSIASSKLNFSKQFNVFSNDGSFLDQFKALNDTKKPEKSNKSDRNSRELQDKKHSDERNNRGSRWSKSHRSPSPKNIQKSRISRFSDVPPTTYESKIEQQPYIQTFSSEIYPPNSCSQSIPPQSMGQPLIQSPQPQLVNFQNIHQNAPLLLPLPQMSVPMPIPPLPQINIPPPHMQSLELSSIPPPNPIPVHSIPQPEPLNMLSIPPPAPLQLQNIPPPSPIQLNEIPNPKPIDLLNIPAPAEDSGKAPDFIKNIPPPNKAIPPPALGPSVSTSIPALMEKPILPPMNRPPPLIPNMLRMPGPPPLLSQPPPMSFSNPTIKTEAGLPPPTSILPTTTDVINAEVCPSGTSAHEAMVSLGRMVAQYGPGFEEIVRQRSQNDPNLWFLYNTQAPAYHQYQQLVEFFKQENSIAGNHQENSNNYKPEDIYEPELALEEDENNKTLNQLDDIKYESRMGFFKMENSDGESSTSNIGHNSERKRKRKSRWENHELNLASNMALPLKLVTLPPGVSSLPPQITPQSNVPTTSNVLLSKITRNDPALIQYAVTTFGSTNISEDDWKKAEDHFKINLLYQDMLKKRQEIEKLQKAGKNKYEYDSDEETDGGTWEHKMRGKEMEATQIWAQELNKQSEGKHHIGDFLPPDEYKKFVETCNAAKEGREPDLSDYKECKIKDDNIGFKMLQKLGWSEGQGLGTEGAGIVEPINKAQFRDQNQGLGLSQTGGMASTDDEYDAYRKRMMLAYRFRPNPLNNPRRPYY